MAGAGVTEPERIALQRKLTAFRDDHAQSTLSFPKDLSNAERRYLHAAAPLLGLQTKSRGSKKRVGERYISVYVETTLRCCCCRCCSYTTI